MPFGKRRNKVGDRYLCDGCTPGKPGAPGRPIGMHGSLQTDLEHCGACGSEIGDAGLVRKGSLLVCAGGCKTHGHRVAQRKVAGAPCMACAMASMNGLPHTGCTGCDCAEVGHDEAALLRRNRRETDQMLRERFRAVEEGREASKTAAYDEDADPDYSVAYWRPDGDPDDPDEIAGFDRRGEAEDFASRKQQDGYDGEVRSGGGVLYDFQASASRRAARSWSQPPARRVIAHDSGDGETIYHCPFCGAGQVIARSDGTTECGFCETCFTVQVQPKHPQMPQTVNGVPVDDPSMPGDGTHEDPSPATQIPAEPGPEGFAPAGTGGEEGFLPAGTGGGDATARRYRTATGALLDEEAYIRHLAIAFADDKDAAIDQVRASR